MLAQPKSTCKQVAEPDPVRATDKLLEYNMTHGSGIRNQLDNGKRESAGKTGTADGNNESWFVGYTPNLVTAVWVGTPDDGNKRVMKNVTVGGKFYPVMHGAAIAAPIWKGIMNRSLAGKPIVDFTNPSDKLLKGENADIPSVTGLSVQDAITTLETAGFQAGRRRHHGPRRSRRGRRRHLALRQGEDGQLRDDLHLPRPVRPWVVSGTGRVAPARRLSGIRPDEGPDHPRWRALRQVPGAGRDSPGRRRQPARTRLTTAATRPPSARPATACCADLIARPSCGSPVAPEAGTASRTMPSSSASPSCWGR